MIEFIFDLQRFAIASQAELEQAIADAEAGDTITLTGNIIDGTGLIIDKNITIDFGNYTYTTSGSITINYNVTATLKNGTINFTNNATVENNYVLTLDKMALSGGSVNATGTISAINGTTITLNEGQSLTYNGTTYKATARDKTVVFEFQGEDGTPYVKGLNNGSEFTAKTDGTTITYTVRSAGLFASDGTTTKYYTGDTPQITKSILMSELAFTSEKLQGVIETTTDYNKITLIISNTKTSAMKPKDEFIVISSDYATRYGLLEKTADDSFKLTKDDKATGTLDAIKITGNYKVDFEANNFKNIPITVSNSNEFTVLDDKAFTVSGQQTVSVATAQNVGLTSGNIITAATDQTIGTSNYTISGYTDSKSINNGIYVSANNDGGATVGGIDNGESFTVTDSNGNPTTYTMNDFGLVDKDFKKVYMGESVQTGNSISVDLSKLADGMRAFITPKDNVLTVGGNNNFSAVVLSTDSPSTQTDIGGVKKYAELEAVNSSPTSYHLKTVTNGAALKDTINTVSVASGQTTIDTALVSSGVKIQTKDVTFTVQNTGNASYFVVDGSSQNAPTVTNATELTLLSGKMTATATTQTIKLGDSGVSFVATSSGMEVSVNSSGNYVVNGVAGNVFTLGGKQYTIGDSSDGMIFTIDKTSGEITISDWNTNGEILTVGTGNTAVNYAVRPVGFIKQDASGNLNLWTGTESSTSLQSGTVTVDELLNKDNDNWAKALATVNASRKAATLSSGTFHSGKTTVTLVGNDYNNFFGQVTNSSNTYALETLSGKSYTPLTDIYLASGVVSAGQGLTDITLSSGSTTLSVTNDKSDGYQVTLSSGGNPANVSKDETANLISGKLKVDSTFTAQVLSSNVITGNEGSSITLTADDNEATISGLDTLTNKSFNLNNVDYGFSVVGLTRGTETNKQYLLGSKGGTVTLKGQMLVDSQWGGLLSANALTLTETTENALIVDDVNNAQILYADYNKNTKTLSKSDGGTAWDTNNTIHVDNTTVTLTSDFRNAPIKADKANTIFKVTDNTLFTVADSTDGATIGNAKAVSLTSGLIVPANGSQSISTAEGTITNANEVQVSVSSDSKTYITDIANDESFKVNSVTYTKNVVGLMNNSDQLLTDVTVNDNVAVASLNSGTWKNTVILSAGNNPALEVPSSDNGSEWIILNNGLTEQHGTITAENNVYNITKASGKDFRVIIKGANFYADSEKFTITAATETVNGASIAGADNVTQMGGRVAIQNNQIIRLGNGSEANSVKGTGSNVVVSGTNDIVLLNADDTFIVNNTNYTLVGSGRITRDTDDSLYYSTIKTANGSVAISNLLENDNWTPVLQTDENNKLKIDADAIAKAKSSEYGALVHKKDDPSAIYGTLVTVNSNNYNLTTNSKTATDTIGSIELTTDTASRVTITSDFNNIPIIAGSTEFVVTESEFIKVNYTSDETTGDSVSVNNKATQITLNKGTLDITSSSQILTAGDTGNTLKASGGNTVSVTYNATDKKTTAALDAANKAINTGDKTYQLTATNDDGITVEIASDGTKTVTGITAGDEFKIGANNYKMTDTKLLVKDNQLWTGDVQNEYNLTYDQLTDKDNWANLIAVADGNLTISGSTTGILVDDISKPTKIYGRITDGNSLVAHTVEGMQSTPLTSITVSGVTASISEYFNNIPVKLESNATVNYTNSTDSTKNATVSGTLNKVVFGTMTFTPAVGDEFTLDGTTYHMYTAGLTNKDAGTIWKEAATSYVLPDTSNWLPMLTLESDGTTLNLSGSQTPTEGENIIVDTSIAKRAAKLTYATNSYTFTALDGTVGTVQLPAGTLTVTTAFATTVKTAGAGKYTVNSVPFTGTTELTIDATATSSTLSDGTVTLAADAVKEVTTTDGNKITNTGSTPIIATAQSDAWTSIGQLDDQDSFTINDGTKYQALGSTEKLSLVRLDSDGTTPVSAYENFSTDRTFNYSVLSEGTFLVLKELETDGSLDLTNKESINAEEYLVIEKGEPTSRVAKLAFDGSAYTLSTRSDGNFALLDGVKLSQKIRSFNTTQTVEITTTEIGRYTINSKVFNATDSTKLPTIETKNNSLTSGTVTLVTGRDYAAVKVNEGKDTITATRKDVDVTVNGTTVTIDALDNGDKFTATDGTEYTKINLGFTSAKGSSNKIRLDSTATTITLDELSDAKWTEFIDASNGDLTITTSTQATNTKPVVDLADPAACIQYGTLRNSGGTYTYTGDTLASVKLTSVKAKLDAKCSDKTTITANNTTFTATATAAFTVDATTTVPTFKDATAINLTSGTIQATLNIPITAEDYVVTSTKGDMTINNTNGTITVDGLAVGEGFTVKQGTTTKTYTMTQAGLTDESSQIHTNGVSTDLKTVTLNDLELGRVLVVDSGGLLDLTLTEKTPAEGDNIIVDNSKTKRLAQLTYTKSSNEYVFNSTSGNKVDSVKLPDGTLTATTDFVSTINTGNGTYTINSKNYKGAGLEIAATATTSTLTNGTVSLATNDSVTATVDGELVDISGNGFEATVKDGSFTELTTFNTGDSFTYKTNTYLQTDCGLKRTTTANVDTINEKLTDTTLKFSKLDEEDNFIGFLAPVDGTLNLTGNKDDAEAIVFDNTDSPKTKLGKFTIKDDGTLSLKGETTAAAQITTVAIDPGNKFSVDFVTQVEVAAGEVTVNKKTFVGQKKLTLYSDGKTSTLFEGTITLNTTNPSAQATKDTTPLKVTAAGNITAVAEEGKFTDVKNLVDGDKFTFSEHTYTKSAVGLLRDDKTICEDLGSSVDIEELLATSTVWQNYIAPTNKAIDLTGASNALVFDNTTLPTKKLGTLTVDSENQVITFESENATDSVAAITKLTIAADTELVVDFATDVAAPIGSVIVNDAYYNGTSALTIHSDGTTSTLTEGTITLSSNGTVTTTSNTTVNATGGSSGGLLMANSSDILTVNVDSDGKINLSDMTVGTSFTVGGNTYKVTTIGVMNSTGKIWTASDYKEGITDAVTELVDDDNWTTVMAVSENLTIGDNTIAVGDKFVLVDNTSNPTKRYGVLSKAAEDDYYLVTSDIDTDPKSITVDKTKIEIGDHFADVPINTINGDGSNTKFTVTVESGKTTFIVAAEDYAAEADNVSDVELEEGPFKPKDGQNVNIADGADKDNIQILLEDGEHTIGGKTFTLAGSQSQAMATVDDNGKLAKISNLVSGATITPKDAGVDGGTCTATADGTTLNYSDTDGYYFDGLTKDAYNISVDAGGHVTVDAGVAFTKVVSSGRTLDDTATIKTAVDTATIPVTVTNNGTTGLNISDTVDDLAKNFSKQSGVVFNANGVTANDFTAAKGTTFIADKGQTVAVGDDFKVVAGTDNVEITIGDNAAAVNKMAKITAPADFGLTLAAAEYTVNDLAITPSGTLNLTTTADGATINLTESDPLTYDGMTLGGTGTATLVKDGKTTLTDGATATNITGKTLNIAGTVTLDGKAITTTQPVDVIGTSNGLSINGVEFTPGNKITITPTTDGMTVDLANSDPLTYDGMTLGGTGTANLVKDGKTTLTDGATATNVTGKTLNIAGTVTLDGKAITTTQPVDVIGTSNGLSINGVEFTPGNKITITPTTDGMTVDLANSDPLIYDDMTFSGTGTANLVKDGKTTLTDGATATNITGKTLNIASTVTLDGKAVTTTQPVDVIGTSNGLSINGVEFTPGDKIRITPTTDGMTVDLANSDPLIYDDMTFSGTGTANLVKDGNASLTSGAVVANAIDKELTVDGIVTVDGKTINAAESTDVFGTAAGLSVGDINLEVFGDDIYTVNIAESSIITGLENIGAADGVTVAGLSTATVLTDAAGPFSVDRMFNAGASVTYGIEDSILTFADDVTTISGDFSKVLTVNNMPYTITGGTATIDTEDGTIDTGAGTFNINGKTYTTNQPTTWTTDNGTVTGADLSADGTLAINQNETDFDINDDILTLTNNSRPVTLTVDSQSGVTEARGINGIISGLDDATVYDVARATIDSTPIYVRNDSVDAVVTNGSVSQLTGLNSGAVVNSAPSMTVTSAENGNFTFVGDRYNVTDADNSVDFITDENSRVTNIGKLEGSLSGNGVKDVTVNDKNFTTSDGNVTIASDGTDITAIDGLASGDTIGGDLEEATFTMPEGQLTMNSATYTLAGDEDGVTMSEDGKRIAGFAREASLTVGEAGSYTINGTRFNANAGDTFTSNRDGVYKFDPTNPPINDTTPASEILALSENPVYVNNSSSAVQIIDLSDEKTLALIDSPNGNTSVKTGMGNDSVIARHGGNVTVDVADGDATIIPTATNVMLDNYRSDGDAAIKTYEYTNIPGAIKSNDILFGDGVMTLGDAVINFGSTSATSGATFTNIINTTNQKQPIGFTHTAGGTADVSEESSAYVLKGNYAESDSDTQKTAGSTLLGGSGNDTLLIGAGDVADAGDGTNKIYVTDPSLRAAAATIVLNAGKNTVYKFSGGHDSIDDRIQVSSLNDVEFGYGSGLTMTSGDATLTFNGLKPSDDLVTVTGANASLNAADPYKIRLTAGSTTYNAEIAQSGKGLGVAAGDTGNLFYGNGKGISFSEFTGNVSVNLNDNSGSVGGRSARFYNFDKVAAGAGNSTLIGENGVNNTLMAGTGSGVIRSGAGADLMVGTDGYENTGRTRFYYTAGYGRDTITNFDFMASSGDTYSDYVEIGAEITGVSLQGANVVIGVEGNDDDYLTLVNAANQHFAIEGGIAKVGTNLAFDGMTDYYVGATTNSTVGLAANMGNTEIWLGGEVGDTRYFGDISVINAANANGENILAGNSLNNMIIGGTGSNSIWGGQGANDDTLVGGSGQNTFFFMANNGNDIVRNAHDGDIVDLSNLDFNKITAADIGDNGVSIALDDGSHFTIEGRASVNYKLSDGSTYTADHNNKTWNQK